MNYIDTFVDINTMSDEKLGQLLRAAITLQISKRYIGNVKGDIPNNYVLVGFE